MCAGQQRAHAWTTWSRMTPFRQGCLFLHPVSPSVLPNPSLCHSADSAILDGRSKRLPIHCAVCQEVFGMTWKEAGQNFLTGMAACIVVIPVLPLVIFIHSNYPEIELPLLFGSLAMSIILFWAWYKAKRRYVPSLLQELSLSSRDVSIASLSEL